MNDIFFGSRSTSTGPQGIEVRSTADLGLSLGSAVVTNNSTWAAINPDIDDTSIGSSATFRIYGFNGTGTPSLSSANWRIDDLTLQGVTDNNSPASGSGTLGINTAGTTTYSGLITVNHEATLTAATGGTANFTNVISGDGSITKTGQGTVNLSGVNTYTGEIFVNGGVLEISGSGSINSTSGITVRPGGSFIYNSSTALTMAPTLVGGPSNKARFSGSGTISAPMTLNSIDQVLSPGNSPGIQDFGVSQTWESFTYDWELNDWIDSVVGTSIDQIQITGGLTLSGTSYALNILSLDALNAAGFVGAGDGNTFTETSNSWTILTTTTGISGFDANTWTLNTSGFQDAFTGTWSLSQSGNNLLLNYAAIPEPKAALLSLIGILLLFRRRR